MFQHVEETDWLYHRGKWSRVKRTYQRIRSQYPRKRPRCMPLRATLRGRYRRWCHLGPLSPPPGYAGILVTAYSYIGQEKASEYLIKVDSISRDEIIYVEDFPDLLEILDLLAPLVSNGIFVDAYGRRPKRR